MQFPVNLQELVDSYRNYLFFHEKLNPHQRAATRFDDRLKSSPESAKAEAVAFDFLRSRNLEPRLLEDASFGGCDFECTFGHTRFAVEVTALDAEKMTEASGIGDDFELGYIDIVVPISRSGGTAGESYMATELENAAHLTKDKSGRTALFRRTYAIVLFAGIDPDKAFVMGFLHPEPQHALGYDAFTAVPFVVRRRPTFAPC